MHSSNVSVLQVKDRVLNYVAYLTDLTWEPKNFLTLRKDPWENNCQTVYEVGTAGQSIHAREMPRPKTWLLSDLPLNVKDFKAAHHSWRLAVLGVGDTD